MKPAIFVTSNSGKYAEAKGAIPKLGRARLRVPEIQADTLEEVAKASAEYAYKKLRRRCFVEDSGLFVEALGGFPGPYSRYANETIGCGGILRLLRGTADRRAAFKAVIAYHDGKRVRLFGGEATGHIAETVRGKGGFGFDPIFIPEEWPRTFAEDPGHKALVSHRAMALKALAAHLGKPL